MNTNNAKPNWFLRINIVLMILLLALPVSFIIGATLVSFLPSPPPDIALKDVHFAEPPYIVKRGKYYFLHYRIALQDVPSFSGKVSWVKKPGEKAYFYFMTVSHIELGEIKEIPLPDIEFARRDAVYWLNPDKSEVHLEVREGIEQTDVSNPSSPDR